MAHPAILQSQVGCEVLCQGTQVKYGFIKQQDREFNASRMCKVLKVSRSGYYEGLNRPENKRAKVNRTLLIHIRRVHLESRQAYGAKKTWHELNAQGSSVRKEKINGCGHLQFAIEKYASEIQVITKILRCESTQ